MRSILAALAVVVLAGSLVRGDDKPLDGDLKKLQGKWMTKAGPAASPVYLTFDKNALKITIVGPTEQETTLTGEFTLDEKGSTKTMDWVHMKARTTNLPGKLSIYAFDGDDKLKIAGGPDEKTRPKEMIEKTSESQPRINTLVFTRVKDDKK